MAADDLVMAMTGASGAPCGVRLLEVLLAAGRTVHLTLSPAAVQVIQQELDRRVRLDHFELHDLLGDRAPSPPARLSPSPPSPSLQFLTYTLPRVTLDPTTPPIS